MEEAKGTHVRVVAGVVEELGRDLEVAADALERARVAGRVALERGEELGGVDAVDLARLRVVGQHVDALERLDRVGLEVPVSAGRWGGASVGEADGRARERERRLT